MAAKGSDFDIVLREGNNLIYARIAREENGYQQRFVRAETQQNVLTQSETPVLKSRSDAPSMYQSTWAGGAQWWKPILSGGGDTYFQSNHMDTWSEPGKVVPLNAVVDAANTNLHDNCVIAVGAGGVVYAIGQTETTDTGFFDVYLWTPASDAFVRDAGQNSGVDDDDNPMAMVYDPSDGYFYVHTDDPEIVRFTPAGDDEDAAWITTGFNAYPGSNIFLQNQNLMLYDGDKLYTVNKSTPAVTQVANDGMGPDFLNEASFAGSAPLFRKNVHLATSTPEGIYYVKNTRQGGQPVAWLFRVDKDSAGNWVLNPIGNLPVGNVALSIAHHLGQVVISATPDWQAAIDNDTNEAEIVLYFMGAGGAGALGSLLGGRDEMDETPYALLGSSGPYLYIGGQKRLWVYDGIRGGLHTAWDWTTELANGAYVSMAWVQDSDGDSALIFLGRDRIARTKTSKVDDPDTVAAFGDDETHYTIESNYFDGGLPMEDKTLDKVEILFDPATGTEESPNQEWTVQISVDDGAYADALTAATTGNDFTEGYALGNLNVRGRRFRYKLIYQTKTTAKKALRAVMPTFISGEMVREYEFVLDGSEFRNINNEQLHPQDFVDQMQFFGDQSVSVALYDNYDESRDIDESIDSSDQVNTKVMLCSIAKDNPEEAMVRLILRETRRHVALEAPA